MMVQGSGGVGIRMRMGWHYEKVWMIFWIRRKNEGVAPTGAVIGNGKIERWESGIRGRGLPANNEK